MMVKDPFCGKEIEQEKAIVIVKIGDKNTRYFCSEDCANKFMKTRLGL
jgi:YHS domain-containing protein